MTGSASAWPISPASSWSGPKVTETTALGAAYLAGLGAGLFKNEKDIAARWALDRRFVPGMKKAERDGLYAGWKAAVSRVR